VRGCFSAKPPIYQPIINVVTKDKAIIGHGRMSDIICEDCRQTKKLKDFLSKDNWAEFIAGLSKVMVAMNTPSYDASFLTFEKLPGYTLH